MNSNGPASSADQRPSPDALLKQLKPRTRGRLKIFLGAAPGVGKTYEMLTEARAKQRDGVDVLVGVVETHGRSETQALTVGLPRMAPLPVAYKGRVLEEMDLDAILARRPQLVLVDELAHTNAPGSRHPKRHLDVEELLEAGLDVYATLNIQHIESLNGVVEQITQVRVRETIPDSVLDQADELEVIDITPEALLQRLREGRVYHGDAAQRALGHYFTTGNLTALRELALRRTAQRVDEQLQQHRREQGVHAIWAAGERVLVCISESPGAENLVRQAMRIAERLDAPWTVLSLDTPRSRNLNEAARDRVAQTLRLAEQLGAVTLTLPSVSGIADDILSYAREHNFTQIVMGKSRRSRWFELRHGSIVDELVRGADDITVQVVSDDAAGTRPPREPFRWAQLGAPLKLWAGTYALLAVTVATLTAHPLHALLHVHNISLIYIAAVLITAVRHGLWPSLIAATTAMIAHNFFFMEPRFTFNIADPANIISLAVFVIVAVLTSRLAVSQRTHMLNARAQAETTAELLAFSRRLAGMRKLEELAELAVHNMARLLGAQAVLLLPRQGRLQALASMPHDVSLEEPEFAAASWCWEKGQPTGRGADTLPGARWLFVPLLAAARSVGVAGVRLPQADALLPPQQRRLLDALCDLAAIAIERVRLAKEVDQAKMLTETEKLRAALLTSVSHDLRTPLASILGSLSSLRAYDQKFDAATREELLATAQEETERMSRFVGNLLDMTRLDAGALTLNVQDCDLREVVSSARQRLKSSLLHHPVQIELPETLPLFRLDPVLMEQVLVNLLDNAVKYAPEDSQILIRVENFRYATTLSVMDEGRGIPPEHLGKIFELFHRVEQADKQRAGIGMGLTVCKGFIEAMGGGIRALNRDPRGACIEISLPVSLRVDTTGQTA